jgi:hypothetical protein
MGIWFKLDDAKWSDLTEGSVQWTNLVNTKIHFAPTNVHCLCYSTQFLFKNARHVSNQFMVHLQGLTFLKLHQIYIHVTH